MPETLEGFLRQKLDEIESNHDYAVATDTVRCWIDQFNESINQPDEVITPVSTEVIKICKCCGNKNAPNATYCDECGHYL